MKTRELEMALAAADPVDRDRLGRLDLEAMEAELLADLDGEQPAPSPLQAEMAHRRRARQLALVLGPACLVAVAVAVAILAGSAGERASRAYGAELVRFAESTPLLLLEGPGWRVQDVYETPHGPYDPPSRGEGSMEFVTGKPIPYGSERIAGNAKTGERVLGLPPAAVRHRKVELTWRRESLKDAVANARRQLHPHGEHWVELPVLGTTAHVDARAEIFLNQGGPNDREAIALWAEDGYLLEMRAAVPSLAAFEERLSWLTRVDSQTWLDAMPAKVVKAADHDATVREMLKGIPVPKGFEPSQIPNEGLTTNRYQVGASVTGIVSCLWFRQWGEARRTGDEAAATEAERAMATSRHWSILREMAREGGYPEAVWELAKEMPSGHWEWNGRRHPLLPRAEGLGCARWGLPVLPWKQRRQRERREQQSASASASRGRTEPSA